jgi:hypothetical protein
MGNKGILLFQKFYPSFSKIKLVYSSAIVNQQIFMRAELLFRKKPSERMNKQVTIIQIVERDDNPAI